jgi:hypothetical protein
VAQISTKYASNVLLAPDVERAFHNSQFDPFAAIAATLD